MLAVMADGGLVACAVMMCRVAGKAVGRTWAVGTQCEDARVGGPSVRAARVDDLVGCLLGCEN